jgi:hypothetical protein
MATLPGQVAAYAKYGARLTNNRWSWSAIAPDGKVVLTLWTDEFDYRASPPTYNIFGHRTLTAWKDRPGNRERIEHLRTVRDHRGGLFHVVIAKAKDAKAETREILEAYPRPDMVMRLTRLDEQTGEFEAVVETTAKFPR